MSSALQSNVTPPNTRTQTTHPLLIVASGGSVRGGETVIGAVNQWNPEQSLQVSPVYEFGSVTGPFGTTFGAPYEKVPGNIQSMQIRIQRYDIWTQQMEAAFGTASLDMLTNDPGNPQVTGQIELREQWRGPNSQPYAIIYQGCWFTNIGRNLQTTGDRIVMVNATVEYTFKQRVNL